MLRFAKMYKFSLQHLAALGQVYCVKINIFRAAQGNWVTAVLGLCVWQGRSSQARDTAQLASSRPPPPTCIGLGPPTPPLRPGATFPVCLLPGSKEQGQNSRGTSPRECSPSSPPSPLLRVLRRAPCRALGLHHDQVSMATPGKEAPHHRWKGARRSKVIFQKGTQGAQG